MYSTKPSLARNFCPSTASARRIRAVCYGSDNGGAQLADYQEALAAFRGPGKITTETPCFAAANIAAA